MVALPSIPGLDADLRPSAPDDINTWVRSSAATHGVPIEILRGILSHESGLDVESSRRPDFGNGGGLGQAIDTTAASYGTSQAELRANPRKAVDVSAQILRDNAAMFGGDYQKAAAAYFVGPGTVQEAQKDPSGDWLAAADRLAAKYNQGTVSSYLAAIGAGGQAAPASTGRVLPSGPTGTAAGALSGSLLTLDPQRVSNRPGYLYDAKGLELANAGDVPVAAGQDDPAVLQANSRSRLRSIADTLGGGALGGIKDFATQQIEPLNKVRDFAGDLAEKGVIGAPGLASLSAVNNAISEHSDLPNVFGVINRAGVESGVPTTPLDTLLTIGPGNLAKGAGLVRNVAKGSGEGAGLLSIIPKNKRQLDMAMEQTLRVAEEAKQAVLASGGTMQEARKAAADAMKNLGKAEAVVDDTTLATERAVASDPFTNTGKRLRRTASDLSERMGSGAIEPKKTGWTITNAAGDVKKVETELPHGYRDAEEAAAGGAMRRMEANHAGQQALNDAIRADEAGARVEQAKKGVRSIRDKARGGLGLVEDAPSALKAPDALSNEADVLDWALKDRANTKSTIGDVARAAKTIGDPFSEARRQFQQGGGEPGNAAANRQKAPEQPILPGMPSPAEATPARGLLHEITSLPGGLIGGMRTGFASGDLPVMRQGGVLAWSQKKNTLGAMKKAVQAYDPLGDGAKAAEFAAARQADPLYATAVKDGLKFREAGPNAAADARAPDYDWMNDSFISKLQGKLPWIKGSERATVEFLNDLAFETYKAETAAMRTGGITDPKRYEAVADVINHAVGYSGSDLAKDWAKINALFSSQYTFSRFNILADPFVHWSNPEARNLAVKNLLSMVGGNTAMLGLMAVTGESTGRWSVNLNPTSGDFGQVKVGNTRYDFLAGFGPLVKTVARVEEGVRNAESYEDLVVDTVTNLSRYFEGKEAPFVKMLTDARINRKAPDPKSIPLMYVPGLAQGVVEAVINNDTTENKVVNAIGAAGLGSISVGANTYQNTEDHADQIASETFDGRKYDDLTPLERLRVVNQLPDDAQRAGRQRATDDYKAALTTKGYVEPEKAAKNETRAEYDARTERNKALTKANAKVFAQDPDLDVQRWFFEDKHGGSLHSKAAVDKALELGLPDRDIKVEGMARPVNSSEQSRAFWNDYGETLFKFVDGTVYAEKYGDQEAQKVYKKRYKDLTEEQQRDVIGNIRSEVAQKDAKLDAALAWWGHGGNSTDKVFVLNTQAAATEYQRLKRLYGESPAKKDYKVVLSKNPR